MSIIAYCLLGLFCLTAVSAHVNHRSCGLHEGSVCIPTACSMSSCLLFKSAVCVGDKCGCEARFFNFITRDKVYQDVTKMCAAGNVVLSFANFTDATTVQDEDPKAALEFFKQFNLLVVEILSDITAYLKTVTEARPTQANIDKLKTAISTLHSLKRTARGPFLDEDSKVVFDEDSKVVRDEDANDADVQQRLSLSGIWSGIKKFANAAAPVAKPIIEGLLAGDEDATKVYADAVTGFKADKLVLADILDHEGTYAAAVKSGKVAISDEDALTQLKEKGIWSTIGSVLGGLIG